MKNENQIIIVRNVLVEEHYHNPEEEIRKVKCTVVRHIPDAVIDAMLELYEDCVSKSVYTRFLAKDDEIRLNLSGFGHD